MSTSKDAVTGAGEKGEGSAGEVLAAQAWGPECAWCADTHL